MSKWFVVWMIGCAGSPVETPVPAPVVVTPAPTPAPVEEAPAAAALVVVVDGHRQIAEGPAANGAPVTVIATAKTNRIDVSIDSIVSYCAPDPSFTAVANAEALELTLVRPDGVSRCFGTHHVDAHVDLPGRNDLRKVIVRGHDGQVLAEAPITG